MDLPDPMERHAPGLAAAVEEFEGKMIILGEPQRLERHLHDAVFDSIIITDREIGLGESWIPLDAVEHILNRLHACTSFGFAEFMAILPLCGERLFPKMCLLWM
jgi:hypothetical protein